MAARKGQPPTVARLHPSPAPAGRHELPRIAGLQCRPSRAGGPGEAPPYATAPPGPLHTVNPLLPLPGQAWAPCLGAQAKIRRKSAQSIPCTKKGILERRSPRAQLYLESMRFMKLWDGSETHRMFFQGKKAFCVLCAFCVFCVSSAGRRPARKKQLMKIFVGKRPS